MSVPASSPPRFLRLPIADFGTPADGDRLAALVQELAAAVAAGTAVPYVHCWGGRGRAGTLGACLLVRLAYDRAVASGGLYSALAYLDSPLICICGRAGHYSKATVAEL